MKNILNISYFNEIVKGIKAMKCDFVCIYKDLLLGTDNTSSNLKIYKLNTLIPLTPTVLIVKELSSEFYNNITDTEIIFDFDECKLYCPNNKSYADSRINSMINLDLTLKILKMYDNIRLSIMNPMSNIIDFEDITNDEYFQQYKELRSIDGAQLYIPKGNSEYGMYLYSGALPFNKSDKVNLICYNEGNIFISKFTVFKKKLNPIDIYFKFVKIK